jgi:hypothetical protein
MFINNFNKLILKIKKIFLYEKYLKKYWGLYFQPQSKIFWQDA